MVIFGNAAYAKRHCCKIGASVVLNTELHFAGFLTACTGAVALKTTDNLLNITKDVASSSGYKTKKEQLSGQLLFGPPIYLPFQGA
jgi:hypothetical protein